MLSRESLRGLRLGRATIMYCTLVTYQHRSKEQAFAAVRRVRVGLSKRIIRRLEQGRRRQDRTPESTAAWVAESAPEVAESKCVPQWETPKHTANTEPSLALLTARKMVTMMEDMVTELKHATESASPNSTRSPTPKQIEDSCRLGSGTKGTPFAKEFRFYTEGSDRPRHIPERDLWGKSPPQQSPPQQSPPPPSTPQNPLHKRRFMKSAKLEKYKHTPQKANVISKEYVSQIRLAEPVRNPEVECQGGHFRSQSPSPFCHTRAPEPAPAPAPPRHSPFAWKSPSFAVPRPTAEHRRNRSAVGCADCGRCCGGTQVVYHYYFGGEAPAATGLRQWGL